MAENEKTEFDFGDIEAHTVERLREAKVEPVPASIIKLAQQSYAGVKHPSKEDVLLHVMRHQFAAGEEAKRDAFVKHMRNAGPHVKTEDGRGATVQVVTDPEHKDNHLLVAWKAGNRRGQKSS